MKTYVRNHARRPVPTPQANTAVSNALLTAMNEREYDDGAGRISIPLISLFGASNELPHGEDLAAFWDRLLCRLFVGYVSDSAFATLIRQTQSRAARTTMSLADLELLQQAAAALPISNSVYDALGGLRKDLAAKGITASDRRWLQTLWLLRASALFEGRSQVEEDDLSVLKDTLWSTPEQRQEIARMTARLANPMNGRAVELSDEAATAYTAAMDAQRTADSDEAKMTVAIQALQRLRKSKQEINVLLDQANARGKESRQNSAGT